MKICFIASVFTLTVLVSCTSRTGESGPASEAKKEAEKYWNSVLTKYGDSYYGIRIDPSLPEGVLYQFKEPQITFKEQRVSDADRLNGLEYAAISTVTYKAYRKNWRRQWQAWGGAGMVGGVNAFLNEDVKKLKGKWFVGLNPEHPPKHWQKINCSEVPQ